MAYPKTWFIFFFFLKRDKKEVVMLGYFAYLDYKNLPVLKICRWLNNTFKYKGGIKKDLE